MLESPPLQSLSVGITVTWMASTNPAQWPIFTVSLVDPLRLARVITSSTFYDIDDE